MPYSLLNGGYRHCQELLEIFERNEVNKKNQLHLALEEGIRLLAKIKPTKLCRYCSQRPVSIFALRNVGDHFSPISLKRTSCSDPDCKRLMLFLSAPDARTRSIGFSVYDIRTKGDNRSAIPAEDVHRLLSYAFELPEQLDNESAIAYLYAKVRRKQRP